MTNAIHPAASPSMPRMGNALTRAAGSTLLKLAGWRVSGKLPDEKKLVIIAAPHTATRDFFYGMGALLSIGARISFLMKKEAFVFPLSPLYRALGAIPVDRAAPKGLARQMTKAFAAQERLWLALAPEGTRSKVGSFKKGYLHIATAANVPLFIVGFNAPTKEIVLDKIWPLTGGVDADNKAIEEYMFAKFTGVRPENQ